MRLSQLGAMTKMKMKTKLLLRSVSARARLAILRHSRTRVTAQSSLYLCPALRLGHLHTRYSGARVRISIYITSLIRPPPPARPSGSFVR